ncbi:MAG: DNA polymerase III subunit delta' [Alphaproteobacteria bacterium]|nr:DNA polymerase III subunit delta' [Alphaproteobacteria bacterium]
MTETATLAPRENPNLKGHDAAEIALLDAAESGRLAHAWIVSGPRGVGKATLTYRFARYLLAGGDAAGGGLFGDAPQTLAIDADNPVFRRIASGGHSDLYTIERTVNPTTKNLRAEIAVDDVRGATDFLRLTPGEGAWRVVIVDAADEMNRAAANAILKMLEEPPPATVFLLVSHAPGRLLPTIRSRCRMLTLHPLARDVVEELLSVYRPELTEDERRALAGLSDGSIGEATALADAGGLALYQEMVQLLGSVRALDVATVHALGDRLARAGNTAAFETFARMLADWLSRLVRDTASGAAVKEIIPGEAQAAAEFGGQARLAQTMAVWEKVSRLLAQAQSANLDRKQVVVSAFLSLQAAVQP